MSGKEQDLCLYVVVFLSPAFIGLVPLMLLSTDAKLWTACTLLVALIWFTAWSRLILEYSKILVKGPPGKTT